MSDDLGIEILNTEDNPEGKLRKHSPEEETLVDLERGVFVRIGVPETNGAIIVPDTPHVLMADELRLRDKVHEEEILLENIVVLIGHGFRDENDEWKFTNSQNVTDTLNGYNEYANKEGLPQAEFMAICNKDKFTEEIGLYVGDKGISETTAYAAGVKVNVTGSIEPDGKIRVNVKSKEKIYNIYNLESLKKIKITDEQ